MGRVNKSLKKSGKGTAAKRSGTGKGSEHSGSSPFRVRRSDGGRRAGTAPENADERAVMLWKGVTAKMKLHDLNLHLQGLYAELGKRVYELQGKKPRAGSKRSRELEDLFGKIAGMRSKKSKIEQASHVPLKIA